MTTPEISIIVPTYNYGAFLGETLEGALRQSFRDWELFLVDDGSTDDTPQVVASMEPRFEGRLHYIRQKNAGVYAARNNALARARGKYIAFLDSDDIWLDGALEELRNFLIEHPEHAMVYGRTEYFDSETGRILGKSHGAGDNRRPFKRPYTGRCVDKLFIHGNCIPLMLTLVRREVFDEVGRFDTKLRVGGDYDFWLRVASRFSIGHLEKVLCRVRRHSASLTFKEMPQARAQLRIVRNILRFNPGLREKVGPEEMRKKYFGLYFYLGSILVLAGQRKKGRRFLGLAWRHRRGLGGNLPAYYALSFFPLVASLNKFRRRLQERRLEALEAAKKGTGR